MATYNELYSATTSLTGKVLKFVGKLFTNSVSLAGGVFKFINKVRQPRTTNQAYVNIAKAGGTFSQMYNYPVGQSFVAKSTNITQVKYWAKKDSSEGASGRYLWVLLFNTDGNGNPVGGYIKLNFSSLLPAANPTEFTQYSFSLDFTGLEIGKEYFMELRDSYAKTDIWYNTSDTYAGGYLQIQNGYGGSWTAYPGYDLAIEIYGDVANNLVLGAGANKNIAKSFSAGIGISSSWAKSYIANASLVFSAGKTRAIQIFKNLTINISYLGRLFSTWFEAGLTATAEKAKKFIGKNILIGSERLDQYNHTTYNGISSYFWKSQSFVPTVNKITKLGIYITDYGNSYPSFTVYVYTADANGYPSGQLKSKGFTSADVGDTFGSVMYWDNIDLDVTPGQNYAIVIATPSNPQYNIVYSTGNAYPAGRYYLGNSFDGMTEEVNQDLKFEVYGESNMLSASNIKDIVKSPIELAISMASGAGKAFIATIELGLTVTAGKVKKFVSAIFVTGGAALDQNQDLLHASDDAPYIIQSFTPTVSTITKISLLVRDQGYTYGIPLVWSIYAEDGNDKPTGPVLATKSWPYAEYPDGWAWLDWENVNLNVTPGTKYVIRIRRNAPTNYAQWGRTNNAMDYYTRGRSAVSADGSNWIDNGYDMAFRVYGESNMLSASNIKDIVKSPIELAISMASGAGKMIAGLAEAGLSVTVGKVKKFIKKLITSDTVVTERFYPTALSGKGVYKQAGAPYTLSRDALVGTGLQNSLYNVYNSFLYYYVRAFFSINTPIPSNAIIVSARFSIYFNYISPENLSWNIYDSSCDDTQITINDYSRLTLNNPTAYLDNNIGYTDPTQGVRYVTEDFNEAGLAAIQKGGYTKFCLRVVEYDVANDYPKTGANNQLYWDGYVGDPAKDPYIEVTYRLPAFSMSATSTKLISSFFGATISMASGAGKMIAGLAEAGITLTGGFSKLVSLVKEPILVLSYNASRTVQLLADVPIYLAVSTKKAIVKFVETVISLTEYFKGRIVAMDLEVTLNLAREQSTAIFAVIDGAVLSMSSSDTKLIRKLARPTLILSSAVIKFIDKYLINASLTLDRTAEAFISVLAEVSLQLDSSYSRRLNRGRSFNSSMNLGASVIKSIAITGFAVTITLVRSTTRLVMILVDGLVIGVSILANTIFKISRYFLNRPKITSK